MKKENKNAFFWKYLKSEKISLDIKETNFQLDTHPHYPSLLSFHDALNFFNINNIATRVEDKNISFLPDCFIAEILINGVESKLAFIEKREEFYDVFIDNDYKVKMANDEFKEAWSGVVLAAEKREEEIKSSKTNFNTVFLIFSLVALASLAFYSIVLSILSLFILLGVFLGIEAVKQEFHVVTDFSSKFCNAKNKKSNCDTIINSSKFKLFRVFSLADLSIVFFIGQLIASFILVISGLEEEYYRLTFCSLLISLPITLISLIYQWKIAKKWCSICLGIIFILYIETIVILMSNSSIAFTVKDFSINSFFLYLLSFIIPIFIWRFLKPFLNNFFDLKIEYKKLYKLKRNYSLFKNALIKERKVEYENLDSEIKIGNNNSKLKLSIVTNPMCKYCKEAHFVIEKLIEKHSNDICINVLFSFDIKQVEDESLKRLHFSLISIYLQKGQEEFMKAMGYWFSTQDYENWFDKYQEINLENNVIEIERILTSQNIRNKNNNIIFTPSLFLGEYSLPRIYETNDIELFVDDLLEDDNILISTS